MKNYVRRDKLGSFLESKIVMDSSLEWSYLSSGIDILIKQTKETIELYRQLLESCDEGTREFDEREKVLQEYIDKLEILESMGKSLKVENEIKI